MSLVLALSSIYSIYLLSLSDVKACTQSLHAEEELWTFRLAIVQLAEIPFFLIWKYFVDQRSQETSHDGEDEEESEE